MNGLIDPYKEAPKSKQNSQFSESGVFVKEDDQDWGSAGMDNIEQETDLSR